MDEIRLAVGGLSFVRLWRCNTGVLKDQRGKRVAFGLKGSADLTGLMVPDGRRLEIEVKRPGEHLTKSQQFFGAMIRMFGGVFIHADSASSALRSLSYYVSDQNHRDELEEVRSRLDSSPSLP